MASEEEKKFAILVLDEIRTRMEKHELLEPIVNASQKYQQYKPKNGSVSVWDQGKCHFEFEFPTTRSELYVAFHCERGDDSFQKEVLSRKKLGELIGKKMADFELHKYEDESNCKIVYKTIDVAGKNVQQVAEEAVTAMNMFASEGNVNTITQLIEQSKYLTGEKEAVQMTNTEETTNQYVSLLLNNHNIILHGAPGTGKTYLAKDIAQMLIFGKVKKEEDWTDSEKKAFNEQYGFVQFHQSYDYTDFVEGLRPKDDEEGHIGFERKDGIFKDFCGGALSSVCLDCLKNAYDALIESIKEGKITSFAQKTGTPILVKNIDAENNIILQSEIEAKKDNPKTDYEISYDNVKKILEKYGSPKLLDKIINIKDDIRNCIADDNSSSAWINSSAYWAVAKYLINETQKKYVFVIDEINRGEMSKIFGELFFSVDPGYRGKDGSIKTQYANLQKEPNEFDKALGITKNEVGEGKNIVDLNIGQYGHFFVPENVYIIGTMNDIDRSVESMDFAMRRRFAFEEITAAQSQESMFGTTEKWKKSTGEEIGSDLLTKIKNRMDNLNKAIVNKELKLNLGPEYQIGGAYFLKFAKYYKDSQDASKAFANLWDYHIKGVLREYLRGMDDVKGKLEKLQEAYNTEVAQ